MKENLEMGAGAATSRTFVAICWGFGSAIGGCEREKWLASHSYPRASVSGVRRETVVGQPELAIKLSRSRLPVAGELLPIGLKFTS